MKKLLLPLLLAALLLPACSAGKSPPTTTTTTTTISTPIPITPRPTPNATERQPSDPSQTIVVNSGDEFTVTVRTQAAPDLHWELSQALDPNVVAYVWKSHVPDDPNKPNGSGEDVWRFAAKGPGKASISLGYYQGATLNTMQTMMFQVEVK